MSAYFTILFASGNFLADKYYVLASVLYFSSTICFPVAIYSLEYHFEIDKGSYSFWDFKETLFGIIPELGTTALSVFLFYITRYEVFLVPIVVSLYSAIVLN